MATADSINNSVQIPLSRNHNTVVSPEDGDLRQFRWTLLITQDGNKYARRNSIGKNQYLHRVVLERVLGRPLLSSELIDHKDGDSLNNQRGNLRLATNQQNQANSRKSRNSTSGYKGVYKENNRWKAQIMVNRKAIRVGLFDTPELAYEAYCEAARQYFGEFARSE